MSEPQIRYTRAADGMRIAYQFIEGADPVILTSPLIGHQFDPAESIPSWVDYREALRGDNAWAILDYRGSGLSGRYEGAVTIEDFALDLEAVVQDLSDRPQVLIATTSGIGPAVEYVIREPDRTLGMLLQAPGQDAFDPLLQQAFATDLERGFFLAARSLYDWESETAIRPLVQKWMVRLRMETFWEASQAHEAWDMAARLKSVTIPIVMTGAVEHQEGIAELAADLADARVDIDEVGPVYNERSGLRNRSLIDPWIVGVPAGEQPADAVISTVSPEQLTPRQLEVLALIADGLSNPAIAARLGIAPGTVARHVADILSTTGLHNRTEAARYAVEHRLLP